MDGFTQKKWFVYLTDHHEGPFSLAELQTQMEQGSITPKHYVWCQGMPDWKIMAEVEAFEALLQPQPAHEAPTPPSSHPIDVSPVESSTSGLVETVELVQVTAEAVQPVTQPEPEIEAPVILQEPQLEASPAETITPIPETTPEPTPKEPEPQAAPTAAAPLTQKKKPFLSLGMGIVLTLLLVLAAGGAVFFYLKPTLPATFTEWAEPQLIHLTTKFPSLAQWISPLPKLADITPAEYEELRAAASAPLSDGPTLAAALSLENPGTPSFYISSNLPNGAVFEIWAEGIPDTLLNQFSFNAKSVATLHNHLGKTGALQFPDGKHVPKGEYIIYTFEASQQPAAVQSVLDGIPALTTKPGLPAHLANKKILMKKISFLGGAKDATYESRLKEFHEKINQKAATELAELKQFYSTLDLVLKETILHFETAKKQKNPKLRTKTWNDFQTRWAPMEQQIQQTFSQWTPEVLENQFYYSKTYNSLVEVARAILKLRAFQGTFFSSPNVQEAPYMIQLGAEVSTAQASLAQLAAKIEVIEKTPPSSQGLPKREGM